MKFIYSKFITWNYVFIHVGLYNLENLRSNSWSSNIKVESKSRMNSIILKRINPLKKMYLWKSKCYKILKGLISFFKYAVYISCLNKYWFIKKELI